ncbi:hypothetical protein FPQ18DRAFT_102752 [Pyronema domesticum]|nr:hypothetical protein FPQ18DRAFT_102752 [Pyronema domesticum]
MDPLSLSASTAGFLSLAIELTKILTNYSTTVKSAPREVSGLTFEVEALSHVLDNLVDILRSDDSEITTFSEQSILCCIISASQKHITDIYRKLVKQTKPSVRSVDRMAGAMRRLTWPFEKDERQ